MIDSLGRVLQIQRAVKPWRAVLGPKGTHAVLEAASGWLEVAEGEQLRVEAQPAAPAEGVDSIPPSISFLVGDRLANQRAADGAGSSFPDSVTRTFAEKDTET